jgi:hypothetical protein
LPAHAARRPTAWNWSLIIRIDAVTVFSVGILLPVAHVYSGFNIVTVNADLMRDLNFFPARRS